MVTPIVDLEQLRAHRAAGHDLRRALLVELDLTAPDADRLLRTALDCALFLGCRLTEASRARAVAAGALLFPDIPYLPYRAYRSTLYRPAELFAGFDPTRPESYADTMDAKVYRHVCEEGTDPGPLAALSRRLHDHGIAEALQEVLADTGPPVAVMGGHELSRDAPGYRAAVRLGQVLGHSPAGFTVLTGGGPGAMEAVPLGVRLSEQDDTAVEQALAILADAPRFSDGGKAVDDTAIGRWLAVAGQVDLPADDDRPRTIGIPTWFYGHEPPNPFVHLHAKYFANSVREDGLLTVATGGVVYTPGSAGTVQEVFQDYTHNHYGSLGPPAPMVFLHKDFWVNEVPAAPLVQQLAKGRESERWILVTDDLDEAVALLEDYAAQLNPGRRNQVPECQPRS
jgi:predicted Rossmann-fold nucleotide-binding protein